LQVHVEPGHRHGSKVVFRGEAGSDSPDVLPGDLIFILEQVGVGDWVWWGRWWFGKGSKGVSGQRLARGGDLIFILEQVWMGRGHGGHGMAHVLCAECCLLGFSTCFATPSPCTPAGPVICHPSPCLPSRPSLQKEHASFKRIGADLFYEKTVSLVDALCGEPARPPVLQGARTAVRLCGSAPVLE